MKSDRLFDKLKLNRLASKINLLHAFCLVIALVVVILSFIFAGRDDARLLFGDCREYNYGWKVIQDGELVASGVTLPYSGKRKAASTLELDKKMGDETRTGQFILFRITHTVARVYIDNREVYSFGADKKGLFSLPGNAWILIPLKDRYRGKHIRLQFYSPEKKYSGATGRVYIGSQGGLVSMILKENRVGIITSALIFLSAIFMLLGWILTRRLFRNDRLLHLFVFEAGVCLWSLNETCISEFVFDNMTFLSTVTFEVMMLLPMPLLLYYCESNVPEIARVSRNLAFIPVINFLLCNLLFVTGVMDLSVSMVFTHICILVCAVGMVVEHVKLIRKKRANAMEFSVGSVGVVILAASMLLDMLRYYIIGNFMDAAELSRIGMLIFILCLAYDTIGSGFRFVLSTRQADVYRQLAFTDNLTGMGNRQAYEEKLAELDADDYENMSGFVAAMLDLNNLKHTNDTLGHAEGDKYIINSANFVNNYFGKIADIYRLGGDEFAIIYAGKEKKVFFDVEKKMFEDIADNNRTDINFSYGSAFFDVLLDRNIGDTVKRADERMYEAKRKYKQSQEKK